MDEEKEIVLTEEILLKAEAEDKLKVHSSPLWGEEKYDYLFPEYASKLTISEIEDLCKILQHSMQEIYDDRERIVNGKIIFGEEKYYIVSQEIKSILLEIVNGDWNKNDILYDISLLLTPEIYPKHASLRTKVYNYLLKEKYIEIDRNWLNMQK